MPRQGGLKGTFLRCYESNVPFSPPRILEDLADVDDSPWNMSPDATERRVILCMGLSRVAEAARLPGHDFSAYLIC